jgi:uncharacterized membrane protein YczE
MLKVGLWTIILSYCIAGFLILDYNLNNWDLQERIGFMLLVLIIGFINFIVHLTNNKD